MRARLILCGAATALAALTASLTASASFPGANGKIVFQSNRAGGTTAELYLQNEDGTGVRRLTYNDRIDRSPKFSPDGKRIVFASDRDEPGNVEIYVMELATGAATRVTNDPGWDDQPVFTGDGRSLVWQRTTGAPFACPCSIWTTRLGSEPPRLVDTGGDALMPDVSPRDGTLTFTSTRTGTSAIYVQRLDGSGRRQVLPPPSGFGDFRSRWSPSGRDLVFARDDNTNNNDIYTVRPDRTGLRQITSGTRFDEHASFSPDGKRILFAVFPATGGSRLYTIRTDGTGERIIPQLGAIAETFDGPSLDSSMWWQFITGTGGAIAQINGRAELSLVPEAAGDPGAGYMGPSFGMQCSALGDYDARVRYQVLDYPAANGTHANFGDSGMTGSIGRRSEGSIEDYLAYFNPVPASAPTTDRSGKLRLVRTGSSLTAYYRDGNAWVPLLTRPDASTDPARLNVHLFSNDSLFANMRVTVAFDDLRVRADEFSCPSWWRDNGPTWQPRSGDDDDDRDDD